MATVPYTHMPRVGYKPGPKPSILLEFEGSYGLDRPATTASYHITYKLNIILYLRSSLLQKKCTIILENLVPRVKIHQALLSQFSLLAEFFIGKWK